MRTRAVVPSDFRARLEAARLETLALLCALDHGLGLHPAPRLPLAALADQDADCGEALWALDQPPHTLDLVAMVRETTATHAMRRRDDGADTLAAHAPAGARCAPSPTRDHVTQLERAIRAALNPREAYNDIPGRDPQNC